MCDGVRSTKTKMIDVDMNIPSDMALYKGAEKRNHPISTLTTTSVLAMIICICEALAMVCPGSMGQ